MTVFDQLKKDLIKAPSSWLVTGVAGFIGSNLLESLLRLDQKVTGLDNLATGYKRNLEQVCQAVGPAKWANFTWIEGDIRDPAVCRDAARGIDFILHQAALGSVPRSLADPISTNDSNVSGCLNMLCAAREIPVKRFVYASSSSVYGDATALPQVEDKVGRPLSPYAVSKRVNELYAEVFGRAYALQTIGLRYFNVFGPRQDPNGAYAAVIPKWIAALMQNQPLQINGDGSTSRDFCYVANVVQANLLAATAQNTDALGQQYSIAVGEQTSLNDLFAMLRQRLAKSYPHLNDFRPRYAPFRPGDIRHSQADVGKARRLLGYEPAYRIAQGLDEALDWYVQNLRS